MNIKLIYLVLINILSFILFGIDKYKAIKNKYRISENTLIGLSTIGGSIGSLLGMILFKHKTKKLKFKIIIPLLILINTIIIIKFILKI